MKKPLLTVKNYNELPEEILQELLDYLEDTKEDFEESLKDFHNFAEFIQEYRSDYEKHCSSDYFHYYFTLTTENYVFSVYGSRYIKDSCICDLKVDDLVEIFLKNGEREILDLTQIDNLKALVYGDEAFDKNGELYTYVEESIIDCDLEKAYVTKEVIIQRSSDEKYFKFTYDYSHHCDDRDCTTAEEVFLVEKTIQVYE